MITIYLDESGKFEEQNDLIKFVGGVVYTGDDIDEERFRLKDFLNQVCKKANAHYPYDLHLNRQTTNYYQVNTVKNSFFADVEKYLMENGKYHITCMIKSRSPRDDYKNISNLIEDNKASNLYEHMICGLLNNLLFHNPYLDKFKNIRLEVPTRVVSINANDKNKLNQFINMGYNYKEDIVGNNSSYRFYLTDQKTFKASLSSKIMNSKRTKDIIIDNMNIKSIDYNNENDSMVFLYFADLICDCINKNLNKFHSDFNIEKLYTWSQHVCAGNEPFLWAYDDIDSIYINILDKFYDKDFVRTFENLYDALQNKSAFNSFYTNHWFNYIEKNDEACFNFDKLAIYTVEMDEYYKSNKINNNRGKYIIDKFWKLINKDVDRIDDKIKYRIADIGLRTYNHLGDTDGAAYFFNICDELKHKVDIEEFLTTLNRSIEIDVNLFNFDMAIDKANYILECLDILKNAKKTIAELNGLIGVSTYQIISMARVLSSLGQFYAFKRDERALSMFTAALNEFGDSKQNRLITISYILHYAIDIQDVSLYEKYSLEYFQGIIDIKELFNFCIEKKDNYYLYTFIKSINTFYLHNVSADLLYSLRITDYNSAGFHTNEHPWELIYKNLGIILYKTGYDKLAMRLMKKATKICSEKSLTISIINNFTEIQDNFYRKDTKALTSKILELKIFLEGRPEIYTYFKDAFIGIDNEIYFALNSKFTFMYI